MIKVNKPKTFQDLKKLIQKEYSITKEDVDGLKLEFKNYGQTSNELLIESTYAKFIVQPNPFLIISVSDTSRLFQECDNDIPKEINNNNKINQFQIQPEIINFNDMQNKMKSLNNAIENEKKKHEELVNKQIIVPECKNLKDLEDKDMKDLEDNINKIVNERFNQAKKQIIEGALMETSKLSSHANNNGLSSVLSINKRSICNSEHPNIKCQGCNMLPIKGFRYLCTQCKAFNYCETCENKFSEEHQHPFMKIRFPIA